MKNFKVIDIRRTGAFPSNSYRFSRLREEGETAVLERDFLGENPLHYYICGREGELIVANNILEIKKHLEDKGRFFSWERVRAVSNNKRVIFDNEGFSKAEPFHEELGPTLQQMPLDSSIDYFDFEQVGRRVRTLLGDSIDKRLETIP